MVNRLGPGKPGALLGGAAIAVLLSQAVAGASTLDDLGITSLRSLNPSLTGAGVSVGQVEATDYNDPNGPGLPYNPLYDANDFEFDPGVVFTAPGAPGVTWVGKLGTTPTTTYNSSQWSQHPQDVATNFFGTTGGAAPGITAAVVYNANYFYNEVVDTNAAIQMPLTPGGAPPVSVVNQSFIFDGATASQAIFTNQLYDNYVQAHGTIFVSGVGNGGGPQVPATAYNLIAVGAYGGASSVGPTSDGRSKPDIMAPATATSYSTPYVSGIVATLVQAGAAGYGGASSATEAAAVDGRTIKALLLNGATKPAGWTHTTTQPLDLTFGAGVANAYNSFENLAAGKKNATAVNVSQTPVSGASVGPAGWDFAPLNSTSSTIGVAHYFIDLSAANGPSTFTSTLVWWRPAGTVTTDGTGHVTSLQVTSINNLDLKLYNLATGQLADPSSESISTVDNVEQIYLTNLASGQYDLEVIKNMAASSAPETYGMAFNLAGGAINLTVNGTVDLHGVSESVGGITGTGTLTTSVANLNATLTVVGTSEFDGVIQDGAGALSLVKSTSGVLTLTGANAYSGGTLLTGGTLLASNATGSATGGGGVTLNGGTLGGHGTISGSVIAGSGPHTIAPSATLSGTSAGTLTVGALTTSANTTLAFNLLTPETINDRISASVANGLTLNGGTIQVVHSGTGAGSLGYYRILQYNGGFNGSLSGLALPAVANNVAYVLDAQHDPGFIDLHRGLLGDANDDGLVNFSDFVLLSNNFGQSGAGWNGGDFNGDGITNFSDFVLLSNDFGGVIGANLTGDGLTGSLAEAPGAGGVISGVPEPASLLLLGAGLLGLVRRRRQVIR